MVNLADKFHSTTARKLRRWCCTHLALCAALMGQSSLANPPDYERESRLKNEIIQNLWDGEIIYLTQADHEAAVVALGAEESAEHEFIAVHTATEDATHVVLMLHGRGQSPLRPFPNDALRQYLYENRIASLAIQLPVLPAGKAYNDYLSLAPLTRTRITESLAWLTKEYPQHQPWLIAHSCGVHQAMDWIEQNGDRNLAGFVGLSMHNFIPDQTPPSPYPIATMSIPLLDVMADNSAPAVLQRAWLRRAKARSAQIDYRAVVIEDSDSSYRQKIPELGETVVEFLNRYPYSPILE